MAVANPIETACTADQWTLVVEDVVDVIIEAITGIPDGYLFTYRVANDTAPSGLTNQGVKKLIGAQRLVTSAAIDVYVYPIGGAGRVSVWQQE
jgi:hypothetical protein